MGAPGPPGGFEVGKIFRPSPYPPQAAANQSPPPSPFFSQPASAPYSPNNFPPNSNVPPKSSSFPPLSGASTLFNSSPVLQGPSPTLNPYYFVQEHATPPQYPHGPSNPSPQPPLSQPSSVSSLTPSVPSSATLSSIFQERGLGPAPSSPLDGARLMALLTTHSAGESIPNDDDILSLVADPPPPGLPNLAPFPPSEVSNSSLGKLPPFSSAPPSSLLPKPVSNTLQSRKLPKGRVLKGERVTYDVDVHKAGEAQPQLEFSPITLYGSDPVPVLGKQIAVNKQFICYGLRPSSIRIINLNTALRAQLQGHTDRVTDMAFFADDVNLLASASKDGRVVVRNIVDGRAVDGRVLITDQIVVALQFVGEWESTYPRIFWHKYKQNVLVVGIGKYVLAIDINKVRLAAPSGGFNSEEPLVCSVMKLPDGINIVGEHEEDVTDLSIPLFVSNHTASASYDGLVRVWGEKKSSSLSAFTPHQGEVVGAVAFLSAPGRPEHSVLLTAGFHLNRELKLWAPEASSSPSKSGTIMWQCIQTVELLSSAAGAELDQAFFNQVVVAPRASLILVANAKKNDIYVLHVEFGSRPEKAQMNYLAEFSVTMPILSLTVTEGNVTEAGEGTVQIYCVQTQAIQQYNLHVSQCLPTPPEKSVKQSSSGGDKTSVKLAASAGPSPASFTPIEKVGPKPSTSAAEATFVSNLTPSVPQRFERLTAAFENLLEGGQPVTEIAKLIATNKLSPAALAKELKDDPIKPVIVSSEVTMAETVTEISFPASNRVIKAESDLDAPSTTGFERLPVPPPKMLPRAKSPAKVVEQRYVPVSTNHAKKQNSEEIRQSGGKISNPGSPAWQPSGKVDDESRQRAPVTSGLGRQVSGTLEKATESVWSLQRSPGLARQQSWTREDFERSVESAPTGTERTSHYSSNTSNVENPYEDEDRRAQSTTAQTQAGTYAPHLITPLELMSLAARSKAPEVDGQTEGTTDPTSPVAESLKTGNTRVVTETEAVQLETVNFPIGSTATNNLQLEASKGMHILGTEFSEKDLPTQSEGPPLPVFSLSQYNQTDHHTEDDDYLGKRDTSPDVPAGDVQDQLRAITSNTGETGAEVLGISAQGSSVAKGRKSKNKTSGGGVGAGPMPVSTPFATMSTGIPTSTAEGETSSMQIAGSADTGLVAQVALMQESLNQLVNMQNELQKQMTVLVAVPVGKEGKRLEVALGQRMEKVLKAHVDAMWARVAEENAKKEKAERERTHQMITLLTNFSTKDVPAILERVLKKEFLALIPAVSQAILPPLQIAVSSLINETFQKGITEKVVLQLEKASVGKLEATMTRQLQTQFQTVGKQALQDAIRMSFESSLIPAFESSCRSMFDQVDSTFRHSMAEHVTNSQQHFSSLHSPLASSLQDTVASASSLVESLNGELVDSHRRLVALMENMGTDSGHSSGRDETNGSFLNKIQSEAEVFYCSLSQREHASVGTELQVGGQLCLPVCVRTLLSASLPLDLLNHPAQILSLQHVEESLDPTVKLMKLVRENKLEEAFNMALSLSDVTVVTWLCNQVDPAAIFTTVPLPLSQGVLLSLVQQLGCDLGTDTKSKLKWIQEAALALNPNDPALAPHMRSFLNQLHVKLLQQTTITGPGELSNLMRLVNHVVNSLLTACK